MSHKEFTQLSRSQREEVLKEYKRFLLTHSETEKFASHDRIKFPEFIASAYASDPNCLYAGWPSNRVNGLCSRPLSNPAFQRQTCAQGQMPCQPLLFGREPLCIGISSAALRRRAFAQCEAKFRAQGKQMSDVVEYISDPEVSQEADELFRLVDQICESGAQASTPMCRNLKNRVAAIKAQRPSQPAQRVAEAPAPRRAEVPLAPTTREEVRGPAVEVAEAAASITTTVQDLNTNTRCPNCEAGTVDEPDSEAEPVPEPAPATPYPRIDSGYDYTACGGMRPGNAGGEYERLYVFDCRTNERVDGGFAFRPNPRALNPHLNVQSRYEGGQVSRFWQITSRNQAFNETFLMMEEDGGGPDSHNVKSYMFVIPRVTQPSVREEGENLIATLPTGETVTMNRQTRQITSGALTEGPVDLNTNRHERRPPNIHYNGSGISIRLDHRYEHPLTSSVTAVVKQGSRTCNVPRTALFNADGKLTTNTDAQLLAVLNRSCRGGGFRLP